MKINYTMYGTGINGGVRVILEIANRLSKRGHEITITTLGSKEETEWFPLRNEVKIKYIPRSAGYNKLGYRIGRKYFKRIGYMTDDSFYVHEDNLRLFKAMPNCDINIATFCLTVFPVFQSGRGKPFFHMQHHEVLFFNDLYMKKLAEMAYWLPSKKIANSTWLKKEIEKKYRKKNLPIVNPGIDHSIFYPRKSSKNKNKIKIISLGRLDPWKGFLDLQKAMEIVMEKEKNIEWIVFGLNRPSFVSTKAPYNFIKAPINQDLAKLYSACDIAVSPSWYESFPLPPLEAMACGTSVITTPYGTEDYAIEGKTALITDPQNPKFLAKRILELINNPSLRNMLRANGIQKAKEFTWDKTVNRVEKILLETYNND